MTIRQRYERTLKYFSLKIPLPETELVYREPFELIVAVILSAQCTDKRVNLITPALLQKYPDAESMSRAEPEEIYEFIKSCSYPNNKAKHLSGMSRMLANEFNGKVPSDPQVLQRLPGVGRKTANVVASVVYHKPVMAVDTHVFRVSHRIGLVKDAKTPLAVEMQLSEHIPGDLIYKAHHWLLLHGRYVCTARNPLCSQCGLSEFCRYFIEKQRKEARKLMKHKILR
jgi:endonuclease III